MGQARKECVPPYSLALLPRRTNKYALKGGGLNLRRSIQLLARETPAPLRRILKRAVVPAFFLRYLYPAPPSPKRSKLSPDFNYPWRAIRHPDGMDITFRAINPKDFFEDAFVHRTVARIARASGGEEITRFFPIRPSQASAPLEGAPLGIIFHVRHCGSTLVCELLKRIREVVVYSEPYLVQDVLALPSEWTLEQKITGLRLLGRLFATHSGERYVWKLLSPNTLFCDLILRAFPQTPWIFCVRDPLEVAVSDLTEPPYLLQFFADPLNPYLPYLLNGENEACSREVYIARAYAAYCRAIAKTDWTRGMIVRYEHLPDAVWSAVASHFGLNINPLEREVMVKRARTHAKGKRGKNKPFSPDGPRKWRSASDELKTAIDRYARPALAELLSLGHKQTQ